MPLYIYMYAYIYGAPLGASRCYRNTSLRNRRSPAGLALSAARRLETDHYVLPCALGPGLISTPRGAPQGNRQGIIIPP